MAFEFKFPFKPPWEDLKAEGVTENGVRFYIFDSCVEREAAKRAAIDKEVGLVLARAERKKRLKELQTEGTT